MNEYPARQSYRSQNEAGLYDADRFRGFRGRLGDILDKRALLKACAAARQLNGSADRILDMPCGTGRISMFFGRLGAQLIGADVSQEMLRMARAKMVAVDADVSFAQMDGAALGFADDTFDCVLSVRFFGHIPDYARLAILKEFRRVSQCAIIEYSIASLSTAVVKRIRRGRLFNALPRRWGWTVFRREQLRDELAQAGLRIVWMWPKLRWFSDSWFVLVERGQVDAGSCGQQVLFR